MTAVINTLGLICLLFLIALLPAAAVGVIYWSALTPDRAPREPRARAAIRPRHA